VNAFTLAALGLLVGFVPLGVVCLARREVDGVVALQVAGATTTLILICLGEGFHRSSYFDLPVVCAAVTLVGGLVFARFFGRFLGRNGPDRRASRAEASAVTPPEPE
jgi:multisubunit Na+/H+ antiporter MnhF subunit